MDSNSFPASEDLMRELQRCCRTAYGAGTLWAGEENRMLEWGEHIVGKQLTRIAALPNAATVLAGTRYFTVSSGFKVWPAGMFTGFGLALAAGR
jgi:hypothetical protein